MKSRFIQAETVLVKKIIEDETWLEGERRHEAIDPNDIAVKMKVIEICLRESEKLKQEAEEMLKK